MTARPTWLRGPRATSTGDTGKRVRIQTDAPRDPTPPRPRLPAPPPPPAGGPPSLQAGVPQAKINSWRGVAAALNRDLGSDAAMKACAWPCLKTFLLGGAPCTTGCGKCAKGAGRGDDAARARARNKLADLDKSGAVEPAVWAMIKDAASSRA